KPPPGPAFKPQFIDLGSDGFNLRVRLTTKGGGVDRLIIPAFPEADKYGKEVKDAQGNPKKLHLIPSPEDMPAADRANLPQDALLPSFLFYHYGDPTALRPEPTLGEQEWKEDKNLAKKDPEFETVALTTDLPDFGVKITKVFTLSRRDYHVGLTLKFEK